MNLSKPFKKQLKAFQAEKQVNITEQNSSHHKEKST